MNKIKDLTDNFFNLLKYDQKDWKSEWYEQVYKRSPTIYDNYFFSEDLCIEDASAFMTYLRRPDFDKLYRSWQKEKEAILKEYFRTVGSIYKSGIKRFGVFFMVGFKKKTFNLTRTSKGKALLVDIWGIRGETYEKERGKILQMDEITALFKNDNQRVSEGDQTF